jgi:hypothetical protein
MSIDDGGMSVGFAGELVREFVEEVMPACLLSFERQRRLAGQGVRGGHADGKERAAVARRTIEGGLGEGGVEDLFEGCVGVFAEGSGEAIEGKVRVGIPAGFDHAVCDDGGQHVSGAAAEVEQCRMAGERGGHGGLLGTGNIGDEAVEQFTPAIFPNLGAAGAFEECALVCADEVAAACGGKEFDGDEGRGDAPAAKVHGGRRDDAAVGDDVGEAAFVYEHDAGERGAFFQANGEAFGAAGAEIGVELDDFVTCASFGEPAALAGLLAEGGLGKLRSRVKVLWMVVGAGM